ncbi:MAG: hypothetical protein HY360_17420 [Verrucomicrobia bacterium]|nr:hypothetical protein [Verrucomicrobiota bacterium]
MTQPRWGWGSGGAGSPRIAAKPQPWAGKQNPVGIPGTAKQLADVVRAVLPERSEP